MSQGRILPLLGPAVVLYLIAEVATSDGQLDATALGSCVLALGLSALPFWMLRRSSEVVGARRVALAGVLAGIVLTRWASPGLASLYLDFAAAIALPALGALTVQLALTVPDRPGGLARANRIVWPLWVAMAIAACAANALAVAPVFSIFGATVLVPPRWELATPIYASFALCLALALRVARRRLGSTPEALAGGLWAQLGLWAALFAIAAATIAAVTLAAPISSPAVRGLVAIASFSLVAGHVAMIGGRRPTQAGVGTRRVLAGAIALAAVGWAVARVADRMPRDPMALGVAAIFAIVLAALAYRACAAALDRLMAPYGGLLLRALEDGRRNALGATSLSELGAAVLPPLRRASRTFDAVPLLWTIDPPRQVRVDAASIPHVEQRELSPAIIARLSAAPGEVVVSAPLSEQVVRRPDLRELIEALERVDALCVVPLSLDHELEGALIVPRGRRRAALTLEEIDRLERLGRQLSAQVSLLSAHERARQRTRDAVLAREAVEEELEGAHEELDKLRADARIFKAGGAAERFLAPAIAYSPAMRALTRRIHDVGPLDAPLLLIAEEGTALDQVGYLVHAAGGRRDGPFVLADCAAVRPERAEAALFGESGAQERPGWLRLAEGGTCLLLDVPALSREAQEKLAEAIATRRAHPADGAAAYPVDARIVATSRVPLDQLVAAGAFDLELYRRLEPLELRVPALRDRREDVPSLVLLSLDRSCRTAGRPVMGIEADALEALVAHDWPGNVRELSSVIDRAVSNAGGVNVELFDLPPLVAKQTLPDPWSGTYAELEARILEHALDRAKGNKSEAARMLGLKRTTFLDKLKRHELLSEPPGKQGTAA